MTSYNSSIRLKLVGYINQRLKLKKSSGGWKRADCPVCDGKYTFGVNINRNKAHCFKCQEHFTLVELLMHMEHFETISQAYKFLSIQQEYEVYETDRQIKRESYKLIQLPDHYHLITSGEHHLAKAARNYLRSRGFHIQKLSLKGVGYCDDGYYLGYIVFPFYYQGNLVYWQTRKFIDIGPKMRNPTEDEFGIGKDTIIYNMDALYVYRTVTVVESITNSITWGENAIATLGKHISPYQQRDIINSPAERIILIQDPDAIKDSISLALQWCMLKQVKLVRLPEGQDVNSIGKREAKRITKETNWGKYMDFYKLKMELDESKAIHSYKRRPPSRTPSRGF